MKKKEARMHDKIFKKEIAIVYHGASSIMHSNENGATDYKEINCEGYCRK
jgi:hypothetical protein